MRSESLSKMTKKLFADSLRKHMEEKPIEKITIKEISEDCGLNRRTFYRHFNDIYDLLEWLFKSDLEDTIKESLDIKHWKTCLFYLLKYFYENKKISYSLIHFSDRKYIESLIYNSLDNIILKVLDENKNDFKISLKDEKFLCNFYSLSFTSLLFQWIEQGMHDSPEYLVENISKILHGSISRFSLATPNLQNL